MGPGRKPRKPVFSERGSIRSIVPFSPAQPVVQHQTVEPSAILAVALKTSGSYLFSVVSP